MRGILVTKSLFLSLALLAFLSGCGGSQATLRGKLVENGQTPAILGQSACFLVFYAIGADGQPNVMKLYTVAVQPDGSFEYAATEGELPPGKYIVKLDATNKAATKGKVFQTRQELKAGANDIIIDLAKPES